MDRLLILIDKEKELTSSIMTLFRLKWAMQAMMQETDSRDIIYHLSRSIIGITEAVRTVLEEEYNSVVSEILLIIEGEIR